MKRGPDGAETPDGLRPGKPTPDRDTPGAGPPGAGRPGENTLHGGASDSRSGAPSSPSLPSAPPAPWTLSGRGWVVLFKAPRRWVADNAPSFIDPRSGDLRFGGGIGSLMIVDYESSPVGSYGELLLIPGRYRSSATTAHSAERSPLSGSRRRAVITHIYVSNRESVLGGRRNWGLPKDDAEIVIRSENHRRDGSEEPRPGSSRAGHGESTRPAPRRHAPRRPALRRPPSVLPASVRERVTVTWDDTRLFDAVLRACGPRFPVSTWFLPFPLMQERAGTRYYTEFRGSGWGRVGRFEELSIDTTRFPDIGTIRPRLVIRVDPFRVTFPPATEYPA